MYQKFRSCQDESNDIKKHEEKYTVAPTVTQNMSENYCKNGFLAFFMVKCWPEHFAIIKKSCRTHQDASFVYSSFHANPTVILQ